ncbi:BTAD domain-containing putative transcriptional regulator [Gaiella sp.]|uniref:AfsR/SARP family transcriptional regulator n=2 Tax=Gaiella sp. TaxID=2663207 RepID=UPI003265BBF2
MEFRILGSLDVVDGTRVVALPGAKHRALLAMLLLHANEVVSTERLTEALWEDEPPETAQKALQVYVSQLRKVLDAGRLLTKAPGYLIRIEGDELDLVRFERLLHDGKPREALALWRGPPLAEFAYADFAQDEIARLDELRLSCLEQRIDADLANKRHGELVGELGALVAEHPPREPPRQDPALDAIPPNDEASGGAGRSFAVDTRSRALPTGTVTLLFADVEGSTLLLQALGHSYGAVLTRLRELVRRETSQRGGSEVDWAGDGVFLAFERAREAVVAAASLQRALDAERWPESAQVRMAIGIHTGEPTLADERYVGMDVHVAARICSAAHGGQVVVSQTTRDVAVDADYSFRYLGDHRLKHVPTPQTLYQLVAPGLHGDFPPLSALGGSTLPALHHRLVGRRDDLAATQALLERRDVRLVTIAGPGGAGKSRLALEAAAEAALERPVHLVGLAAISDAALVPAAIASVVGVRESPQASLAGLLADALEGTRALLVLDNLEQLPGATADITALLDRVSDLDILTTSRSSLQIRGEHVVPLSPLPTDDATTLFFELAAARGIPLDEASLATVQEICRRLDGLPLAIELVTARLVLLAPVQLLAALDDGLVLAMEGPADLPIRQRTLHATLGWSYALLTADQRRLHGLLAVFAGGSALEDAVAVARSQHGILADLEALVAANLLRREAGDGLVRLTMLETVREDAIGRLAEAGSLDDCRRLHADHFLVFAERAEEGLAGTDQARWLQRAEDELDNIRAALDWCLANGRGADALQAVSSLGRFWRAHGHASEARRLLARGLTDAADLPRDVRARALWTAAHEAMAQSDYPAAIPALEEALALFRELGDSRHAVFALCEIARALSSRDDVDQAYQAGQDALELAESSGDDRACSAALDTLAMVAGYSERHQLAQEYSERSLALRRSLGDAILITSSTNTLGMAAMRAGDLNTAERAFTECLELARRLGEQLYVAGALCALGEIALSRELPNIACERLVEALSLFRELGDERVCAECLHALGGAAAARGRPLDAARLWGAAGALRERSGAVPTPEEKAVDERYGAAVARAEEAEALTRARDEGRLLEITELDVLVASLMESPLTTSVATDGANPERSE